MITDYGACCVIVPYLDLINEATINLDPLNYTGEMFHEIPKGAKNGIQVTVGLNQLFLEHHTFLKVATTLVDLLFIELMSHLSHPKQNIQSTNTFHT